jgi:hypothetical protein
MRLRITFILLSLIYSYPLLSQNIFIDSNQVAIFLNGGNLWGDVSSTLNISVGFSFDGIIDIGYQYGFTSIERQSYYDTDFKYNTNTIFVSGIITKKKMQVSIDLTYTRNTFNSPNILTISISLASKYYMENYLDAVFNLSTGFGFQSTRFFDSQEFALTFGVDFFVAKVLYFGPGIGFSGKEFFFGFNTGFVFPFASIDSN